jgi:hypothetical protein
VHLVRLAAVSRVRKLLRCAWAKRVAQGARGRLRGLAQPFTATGRLSLLFCVYQQGVRNIAQGGSLHGRLATFMVSLWVAFICLSRKM